MKPLYSLAIGLIISFIPSVTFAESTRKSSALPNSNLYYQSTEQLKPITD
ncbi:hypothetical protein ACTFQN_03960 [Bacillus cereus group sp. MYBK30-1]